MNNAFSSPSSLQDPTHDAPVLGGKTSGMTAEDYAEESNETEEDDNSNDRDYVPDDLVCSDESDYDNYQGIEHQYSSDT